MLRPSQTVHALVRHPFERERPWRILFIRSLAETNHASIFEGRASGKREALSLPGGGVEALVLPQGVKRREIRFFHLTEGLGYRVAALHDRVRRRPIIGATYADREKSFQQMMLDYPPDADYEFFLEGTRNGEAFSIPAIFTREETLVETLEREARAETGHTVQAMPWRDDQPWVDRMEKPNRRGQVENIAYTIPARITSAYIGDIEETDESAGRVWLNLLDSLPVQLARLRAKRPEYSKLPFFAHVQKVVEILRNKRMKDTLTVALRDEMAQDHPLKNSIHAYGREFPMVAWEWNQGRGRWDIRDLKRETSLIHPSWLLVLEYRGREWEWLISYMRDQKQPISSLTSEECEEVLKNFRLETAKGEIETMEPAPTVAASPQSVVSEEKIQQWRDEGADEEAIRLAVEHFVERAKAVAKK